MIADYTIDDSLSLIQNSCSWGMDLSSSMQGAGGVGGLLAVTDHGSESTAHFFPTYDGNGNVSEYLDASGIMQAHYEYDPFGNTTVSTGNKATDFFHRFSTKPLDAETGLYYYGYRYYDPVTGRWPSRDPWHEEGGLNLYVFVDNSALEKWDFLGLLPEILGECPKCPLGAKIRERIKDAFIEGSDCTAEYLGQRREELPVTPSKLNTCGVPGRDIPDSGPSYDFTEPCRDHDRCTSTCGKTKEDCDRRFVRDMWASCHGDKVCEVFAAIYYKGVQNKDAVAGHNGAQKHWCVWKPCCPEGSPLGDNGYDEEKGFSEEGFGHIGITAADIINFR